MREYNRGKCNLGNVHMTFADLLPEIRSLTESDKLRLIQLLACDLADRKGTELSLVPETAEIWSPYDSHSAAAVLSDLLESESSPQH